MKITDSFEFLWNILSRKYKVYYAFYATVSIANSLIFVVLPFIYKSAIDKISNSYPASTILLYFLLTLGGYLSIRLWSLNNIRIREKLDKKINDILFSSVIRMEEKSFLKNAPGYWTSIFSNDVRYTSQLYSDFLYTLPAEFVMLVLILIVMFFYCKTLLILVTFIIFLTALLGYLRETHIVPKYNRAQEQMRLLNDTTNAHLKGIVDLIHYEAKTFLKERFTKKFILYATYMKNYLIKDFLNGYLISSLNEIGKLMAIFISLFYFTKDAFSFGTAVMLIMFSSMAFEKGNYLVENFRWLQNYPSHVDKVRSAITSKRMKMPIYSSNKNEFKELILRGIKFRYDDETVLQELNLIVKKGEKIVLFGESGAGKSTLLKIISGILEPDTGEVISVSNRPRIGILFQGGRLFNRSLRENLLIAKPNASDSELMHAIEKSGLYSWFETLPDGIETKIGQSGRLISGGERSRLSIARLILYNAEFILLDEPLVGVDPGKRGEIIEMLKEFLSDKTCIIATHDNSFNNIATKFWYLKSGKVYVEN